MAPVTHSIFLIRLPELEAQQKVRFFQPTGNGVTVVACIEYENKYDDNDSIPTPTQQRPQKRTM